MVAGQAVIEMIDPKNRGSMPGSIRRSNLRRDLPAQIALRSHSGRVFLKSSACGARRRSYGRKSGKVEFGNLPPLPPIGELAEVTIACLASRVACDLNAPFSRRWQAGVWKIENGKVHFVPSGRADLTEMFR